MTSPVLHAHPCAASSRTDHSVFPERWLPIVVRLPFYRQLAATAQTRLCVDLHRLIRQQHWHGHGILITDEIQVVIAAQAALLLVGLELDHYPNVHTIAVYPTGFRSRTPGGLREQRAAQVRGEVRGRGTVALAWDAVRHGALDPHDGRNLVFHEFAHALDLLDGVADGRPPLQERALLGEWTRVFNHELVQLRQRTAAGRPTLLDRYGASNRAELFAVATECFFECGDALARQHPDLHLLLWRYYRQDPSVRD